MLEHSSAVSFPHQTNICPQRVFDVMAPTFARPQSFRFLSVETLTTPSVSISNWKWRDTSPTHFWCLSNHWQPPRDL